LVSHDLPAWASKQGCRRNKYRPTARAHHSYLSACRRRWSLGGPSTRPGGRRRGFCFIDRGPPRFGLLVSHPLTMSKQHKQQKVCAAKREQSTSSNQAARRRKGRGNFTNRRSYHCEVNCSVQVNVANLKAKQIDETIEALRSAATISSKRGRNFSGPGRERPPAVRSKFLNLIKDQTETTLLWCFKLKIVAGDRPDRRVLSIS
jgi:hypothetical protein